MAGALAPFPLSELTFACVRMPLSTVQEGRHVGFYLHSSSVLSAPWWWACAVAASILIASIVIIFIEAAVDPEWWRK